jgi:membrane protein YqaA with SNARE-associated domain
MKRLSEVLLSWGPLGLFFIALLDGIGVPIPLGVDLLVITLSAQSPDRWLLFALIGVAGSVAGSQILYEIARKGGEAYLSRHTVSKTAMKLRRWFQHYGLLTVFISAAIPFPTPMKVFVISAGATSSSRYGFLGIMVGARLARYVALAALGAQMGTDAWGYLRAHKWQLAAFAVVLFVVLFLLVKAADYRRARRAAGTL